MIKIAGLKMALFLAAALGLLMLGGAFDVTVADAGTLLMLASGPMVLPKSVTDELERIHNAIKDPLDEHGVRIQTLEQMVAKIDIEGAPRSGYGSGPNVGAKATKLLGEDPHFRAAAESASRGMKPGKFEAAIHLDTSIRAALVNDGNGGTGDTDFEHRGENRGIRGPVMPRLRLLDVLPRRSTKSDSVEYVKFASEGTAEVQATEGGLKKEVDFTGELDQNLIATIAVWTAASKQVLADNESLDQIIRQVLSYKALTEAERLIVNGTGGAEKINGLVNQAETFAPTIATTPADRIGEALTRQSMNGYAPNLILLNPMDWFALGISKKGAEEEDGYLFGSPTTPLRPSLWNTTIVPIASLAQGTAMTLDTSFTTVLDREQTTITVSNQHADFFVRNLVAILAEMRLGLEVTDSSAVYKFDLTPASP